MRREPLILKRPKGWFAAGQEFAGALELLSDGAFKLYVHACLRADRYTARILLEPGVTARILHQRIEAYAAHLEELRRRGVIHIHPGSNGGEVTLIEIGDRFWPYRKQTAEIRPGSPKARFIGKVRDLFLVPACVRAVFTAADEATASGFYERRVSLEQVERAILLGRARKYVSMINGQTQTRIASLQYFVPLVEELTESAIPESYWEPLRRKMEQMEQRWLQTPPLRNEPTAPRSDML